MHTYTAQDELDRVVWADHWDPYAVLGLHEAESAEGKRLVVRAFQPRAKHMWVLPAGAAPVEMTRIHDHGFWIAVFPAGPRFPYRLRLQNHEDVTWEIDDPYRFPPVATEFDLHLFGEGNHHRAWELLGAHLVTHEGVAGVHFAVWAPNAKRVSVIGDFNHWDGRENQLRTRGGTGIWETFIPGLAEGETYKYEVKTQAGNLLEKADPYGYAFEMRPRTGSRVADLDRHAWSAADAAWIQARDTTESLPRPISVYEVHLGSWRRTAENGFLSYHDLAHQLADYVEQEGFTHVELMPVMEHPLDASWGYQVTGYFAPTARFGKPEDFKYFVDHLHARGIGVILDWVPAHFPIDAHGLSMFDGTSLYEHSDPKKGFHTEWQTLIFNYGRNEVRNFLIANALFWVNEYHVDGLRVDAVASMLYLDYARKAGEWIPNQHGGNENLEAVDFIKRLNEVIYSYHPGVLSIAEESTAWPAVSRPTYVGGLGYGLKWNMGWMNDFLVYISKDPVHRKYHHNNLTFALIYAFHENFVLVLSHDEVVHGKKNLVSKMPGDDWQKFANLRVALGYMFAHPGKKLLFMGCEFGQWAEWNFDQSLDWHLAQWDLHAGAQRFVADMNRRYREHRALWEIDFEPDGFQWVDFHDWEGSFVSFLRRGRDPRDIVLAVCNFTPVVRESYRVGVPLHCDWEEILNSDAGSYGGSNVGNCGGYWSDPIPWQGQPCSISLRIPPLAILWFAPRRADDPQIVAATAETAPAPPKKGEKRE